MAVTRKRKCEEQKVTTKERKFAKKVKHLSANNVLGQMQQSIPDENLEKSPAAQVPEPIRKSQRKMSHKALIEKPEIKKAKIILQDLKIKNNSFNAELKQNSASSTDIKQSTFHTKSEIKTETANFLEQVVQSKLCESKQMPEQNKKPVSKKLKNNSIEKELQIKQSKEDSDPDLEQNSMLSTDSGIFSEQSVNAQSSAFDESKTKVTVYSREFGYKDNEVLSSDSEWEDVEEHSNQNLEEYNPVILKEGIEINITISEVNKSKIDKRKKREYERMECARLSFNKIRKEARLCMHKTHLLCLFAHGFYVNTILNSLILKGMALSHLPVSLLLSMAGKRIDKVDIKGIKKVVEWFRSSFSYETKKESFLNIFGSMVKSFETKKSLNASGYNLLFIVLARTLGFKTRLCLSLYPMSHKAPNLIKKQKNNQTKNSCKSEISSKTQTKSENKDLKTLDTAETSKKSDDEYNYGDTILSKKSEKKLFNIKPKKAKKLTKQELKVAKEEKSKPVKKLRAKRGVRKNYKISSDESGIDGSDEDFCLRDAQISEDEIMSEDDEIVLKTNSSFSKHSYSKRPASKRKVIRTDVKSFPDQLYFKPDKIVCWAEIFSKPDKEWIPVECINGIINQPYEIEATALQPVCYVLAYDESCIKDVTKRYCSEYMACTTKLRFNAKWSEETLKPFAPPDSRLNREEDNKLDMMLLNKPLPVSIASYKNHPLYALKRHILKLEALYPPDVAPVGFHRGEPVYPRECVCLLRPREEWLKKQARVVRIGEKPYKVVTTLKWDKVSARILRDVPLDLFGFWQTDPYEPPVAKGGKVPRNEYGNVDIIRPFMLPTGTVHLRIPGLNRIAYKLGIDCAPALVGFDFHHFNLHPVFDGFVICEEFKDKLLAAWNKEQENVRKREEEKKEKRIYGNWKKIIRGLLIRERLKLKYGVN